MASGDYATTFGLPEEYRPPGVSAAAGGSLVAGTAGFNACCIAGATAYGKPQRGCGCSDSQALPTGRNAAPRVRHISSSSRSAALGSQR